MSLEGLDGGCAVRKAPDGGEALHGEMKGVTVLIARSEEESTWGRHKHVHTKTNTHMTDDTLTHTFKRTDTETHR